ncbi:MAG: hypothetical protein HY784_00175 [Chloroflexi bacterium]|nr:hypothetical protein [Chloroflexota bacterium]
MPVGLLLLVVVYEAGPARWIHDRLGDNYHFVAEVLFYGTTGPALAFVLLDFLGRWLEERETSELQAQVLAQARERAKISHQLSDDALQTLFAASALLTSLESSLPESRAQVRMGAESEVSDFGQRKEKLDSPDLTSASGLPLEAASQLREAKQALEQAIQQLHAHLLNGPSPEDQKDG